MILNHNKKYQRHIKYLFYTQNRISVRAGFVGQKVVRKINNSVVLNFSEQLETRLRVRARVRVG